MFNLFRADLNADLDPFSFVQVIIKLNYTGDNLNSLLIKLLCCTDMKESCSVKNTKS